MLGDKLSPGTKPGFLKSEKMLGFKLLYIHKSVLESIFHTQKKTLIMLNNELPTRYNFRQFPLYNNSQKYVTF